MTTPEEPEPIDDMELLRRYAGAGAEADFAALVRRHVNFVYSAALRQVQGDVHLAQEITQVVFTDLARKTKEVGSHRLLAGWLFTSTRCAPTAPRSNGRARRSSG